MIIEEFQKKQVVHNWLEAERQRAGEIPLNGQTYHQFRVRQQRQALGEFATGLMPGLDLLSLLSFFLLLS